MLDKPVRLSVRFAQRGDAFLDPLVVANGGSDAKHSPQTAQSSGNLTG